MKIHEKYIKRCLQLAKNGLGTTSPNPMVGAVIVYDGKIIGEGYTSPYGGNHAEVNAIKSVTDKSLLNRSTIYVSLEPCAHYGKTPPCADLIVEHKIPEVVVGVVDDNSLVSGEGVKRLRNAGCDVLVGILEKECRELNKRFFTFHNKKRPYIILKWAETKDGFIDVKRSEGAEKQPTWISNKYAQQLVHKWRSEEQGIMVGTNTVIKDNPRLNVRSWVGKNPVRIILDNSLRIPKEAYVFDGMVKTILFTSSRTAFSKKRNNVQVALIDYSENVPQQVCNVLFKNEIQSIIIEGGAYTLQSFINANLWDETRIFVGNTIFKEGVKAPQVNGTALFEKNVADDSFKTIIP
ncbi:bifunctional diaminohydroxyphosphoribosylaminopyrimidine deaminase/5-amino-6-(5-phosphoribosylamino)uracil reductase RibD [Urechidicola vernalis]|uniref:Riboflavin biosynthesis protein RibD n=1 Tax=Urechidicola vernalis TaxID=3075600 RepID=A0ABU2YB60_9FLAO|nr:bifunctional diaminohydroxyphosphoribosylaminopyrimidine deaminase/5-amino-6-(5-phosphoribosylamino)uracil reductase RibD [Urechidicola sp. P050]MDT0554293.1 bifunctional diaminohydroxyphosphoribosylaminopyrimidine deaminase/5-amino-6-(5-phosphoribosylamino)uracil reductase RibD [Urechidicola sp. P050]